MINEEEIIETIKNVIDIQEQQISFDRKKVEEILKKHKEIFI